MCRTLMTKYKQELKYLHKQIIRQNCFKILKTVLEMQYFCKQAGTPKTINEL